MTTLRYSTVLPSDATLDYKLHPEPHPDPNPQPDPNLDLNPNPDHDSHTRSVGSEAMLDAYVEAVMTLEADPDKKEAFRRRGQEWARATFSWTRATVSYVERISKFYGVAGYPAHHTRHRPPCATCQLTAQNAGPQTAAHHPAGRLSMTRMTPPRCLSHPYLLLPPLTSAPRTRTGSSRM